VKTGYGPVKASGTAVLLIRSVDFEKFMDVVLPPPKHVGDIYIPQQYIFAKLAVAHVDVQSFVDTLPVDPYGIDVPRGSSGSAAGPPSQPGTITNPPTGGSKPPPTGTYHPVLQVTLSLSEPTYGTIDADKPETFLEIEAESSSNFIHTPPIGVSFKEVDATGNPIAGDGEPVRHPQVPYTVLCPQSTWKVKWGMIPYDVYTDIIVPRLRQMDGAVNSTLFVPLHNAVKGTLLLVSYGYEVAYSWRQKPIEVVSTKLGRVPLVSVTMRIMEKRIEWEGKIHGHQSFWIPGTGWRWVEFAGRATFDEYDYNTLFEKSLIPPPPPP